METWDGSTDAARLERHLRTIFLGPCYCVKEGCRDCADAEEFHGVACDVHDATCQACIAEHALYFEGDHPATKRETALKFEMEIVGGDEGDIATGLWSIQSQIEDEGETSGTQRVNDKTCTWRIKR